jgi:hypothetical protein
MRAVCPHLPTQGGQRKEMKRLKLSSKISYRVSEEQRRQIEEEAEDAGVSANDWCRDAALEKLNNLRGAAEKSPPAETGNGTVRVTDERALLEEIARLGYLIEHGFGIQLSADKTNYKEWVRRVKDSKAAAGLAEMALERGSTGAGMR